MLHANRSTTAALAASLAAFLVPAAIAQTPTYTTTRDACNGAPVGRYLTQNDVPPLSLWFSSSPSDYAFAVVNTQPFAVQVLGFEFWTSSISGSPETVTSHLYQDASGPGATVPTVPAAVPVANGSITVNGFNTW